MQRTLDGRTILVPESRELDLFAGMLEARGARALRCPLVAILDVQDTAPLEAWLHRLLQGDFSDVILLTGEGLRRLLALAERKALARDTVSALGRVRTLVRGPKPARVLREIGLAPGLMAEPPTSAGVIAAMATQELQGRTIGLQLYPGADMALFAALSARGATIVPVTPYRYADQSHSDAVAAAISGLAEGKIDAVAFTSSSQVRRLFSVAAERGLEGMLAEGLQRTRVASIGPVVTEALAKAGVSIAVQPESRFHLKPFVAAICRLF
ncbi:MAG: uroporphyrinogen-III synthase [Alphaproteobacteria bacterium]|nr:uroporphyrinogen-III synthase [Alphaproteobacteria bacterium]